MRDWRSLPVFRSGLPGPDAEHCTMLILRGPLEEIEGGCAPSHAGHVDVEALESAAGHALSGWTATHMPADAIPRADGELALSDKLLEALRGLGADGWMHGITGAEVRLKDETVLWFSAYGRDADATLATMRGVLAGRPVRAGSFALLYRGRGAKERTPLDPE